MAIRFYTPDSDDTQQTNSRPKTRVDVMREEYAKTRASRPRPAKFDIAFDSVPREEVTAEELYALSREHNKRQENSPQA